MTFGKKKTRSNNHRRCGGVVLFLFTAAWLQRYWILQSYPFVEEVLETPSVIPSKATPKSDCITEIFPRKPIVVEEYKLLFFDTPKVASNTFRRLFYSMQGHPKWHGIEEEKHHFWRLKVKNLGSYSRTQQEEMLTSPGWTRAAFLRDPLERVLSAYLNKGIDKPFIPNTVLVTGHYIKAKCCRLFHEVSDDAKPTIEAALRLDRPHCLKVFPYERELTIENFSFRSFVEDIMPNCADKHWEPQSDRITAAAWKFINFVGHVETIQQDGNDLLRRIGAYDEWAEGWGPHQNESLFAKNRGSHTTNARRKKFRDYAGTDEIERKLLEYYRADYDNPMMNFTKPDNWARLMDPPG